MRVMSQRCKYFSECWTRESMAKYSDCKGLECEGPNPENCPVYKAKKWKEETVGLPLIEQIARRPRFV